YREGLVSERAQGDAAEIHRAARAHDKTASRGGGDRRRARALVAAQIDRRHRNEIRCAILESGQLERRALIRLWRRGGGCHLKNKASRARRATVRVIDSKQRKI